MYREHQIISATNIISDIFLDIREKRQLKARRNAESRRKATLRERKRIRSLAYHYIYLARLLPHLGRGKISHALILRDALAYIKALEAELFNAKEDGEFSRINVSNKQEIGPEDVKKVKTEDQIQQTKQQNKKVTVCW